MPDLRKKNTSGFPNVSFSKAAKRWSSYITVNGKRRHLGLFDTPEAAYEAVQDARSKLPSPLSPDEKNAKRRLLVMDRMRDLYSAHGPVALSKAFLKEHGVYGALSSLKIDRAALLSGLGISESPKKWGDNNRLYRGKLKPTWSWERIVSTAQGIAEEHDGALPTLEWFRKNHGGLANAIFRTGHTFEDLRSATGSFKTSTFLQSRNGMRWRSQPECCLSDFLYARGVGHKRGESYVSLNPMHVGNNKYDLHFLNMIGRWIDVEIWGNLDLLSEGRYSRTRAKKERWRNGDSNFLGIESTDCLIERRLEEILTPHIGRIAPFVFDKPTDRLIETAHWSSSDELIESCRQLAQSQPDGIFPNEQWLRKRGRYADRPGEAYNTMAIRINQWLGGTRKVREILGQGHASTIGWTPEKAVSAWHDFVEKYQMSPSQAHSKKRRETLPEDVARQAAQIYMAASRLNVLDQARGGKAGRKLKWTPETVESEWRAFVSQYGVLPTQCMSPGQRKILPQEMIGRATNIYGAARRFNLVGKLRGK